MEDQRRVVLLFDLDCFYAQAERVRLGLPMDVSIALLQWNSVLAVSYPARKFGIKRGDSWDDVHNKSKGECWGIHLKILEKEGGGKSEESSQQNLNTEENTEEDTHRRTEGVSDENDADIKAAFDAIYKLSPEEQLKCRKERGKRRNHSEGKACLERYRIASMCIFKVVLESLTNRLGGEDQFILERASIDEFYLDITRFCSNPSLTLKEEAANSNENPSHNTVPVGKRSVSDPRLEKACLVSHWVRHDVFQQLGFTMSAGISVNKTMAKLAASYGKPNGQAVLYQENFEEVLNNTKLRKVRHFGGKLGKQLTPLVGEDASMGDLKELSLPELQSVVSVETAKFVFDACRGIDREAVRETQGALIKSITAFKSFTATSSRTEIRNWLDLLANEVVTRTAKDTARNHRYPRTCTLNYSYYTTNTGSRPNVSSGSSTRSYRQSKSVRLDFPYFNMKQAEKPKSLVEQAMAKLEKILNTHALRGVGLSASNFEPRGGEQENMPSIESLFQKQKAMASEITVGDQKASTGSTSSALPTDPPVAVDSSIVSTKEAAGARIDTAEDEDLKLAMKLQASYDRENYILSTAAKNKQVGNNQPRPSKKTRRIDTFFKKMYNR